MQRNDLSVTRAPVTEALSDGLGAVSLNELEKHLKEIERGVHAPSATEAQSAPLDIESLIVLFSAEAEAIDKGWDA